MDREMMKNRISAHAQEESIHVLVKMGIKEKITTNWAH